MAWGTAIRRGPAWAGAPAVLVMAALALAASVSGCSSGDSTVSKTPLVTPSVQAPAPANPTATAAPPPGPAAPAPGPADPCAVDLAAPEIVHAVSDLPRDPRSGQPWNPEPIAGNFSPCAALSAVVVRANTNADHPNTRAVLFHLGKAITTGVPDTYGFNGIDAAASTADTVALRYADDATGLRSVVRLHWNGSGVELIGNTGR